MKSWRRDKIDNHYMRALNMEETVGETVGVTQMPEVVKNWLSQLILLKDVPLAYLVVDEREMPIESIRFFTIDPHWTEALVHGAVSIGALTKNQKLQVKKELPHHYGAAKTSVRLSRYEKMHPNHKPENMCMTTDKQVQLSGFIMRSDLVSHWKGIEVVGYMGSSQRDILRLETLSEKVLICIFEDEIDTVKMYEPKEVLHFGTRAKDRKINVRRIDEGHEGQPLYKDGTKENVTLTVPTTDTGRLKVTALRDALSKDLSTTIDTIDSPQLALEMLSVAGQCAFERGK